MKKHKGPLSVPIKFRTIIVVLILLFALVFSACSPAEPPTPTQDLNLLQTQSAAAIIAQMTAEAPPQQPTLIPLPGPDPVEIVPVEVITQPEPGQPSVIADFNTLIYGGPGTNYETYGAFLSGKQALVVGISEDGLWWAIDIPVASSNIGWVNSGWVTISNAVNIPVLQTPPIPPSTVLVPPGPEDPQATALANVSVRTGPSTQYPAYGIAETGTTGWVIGKSAGNDWLVVRLNPKLVGAGYGWVPAQNLHVQNADDVPLVNPSSQAPIQSPPPPSSGSPVAKAVEYLYVRTGPGMHYGALFISPAGATGEVTGRSADNEWWQIKISDRYISSGLGWVSRYYVTTVNTDYLPVVDAPPIPEFPAELPNLDTCELVAQNPNILTTIAPNTLFTSIWTLRNTDVANWDVNAYNVRFLGADGNIPLHQGADLFGLSTTVEVGQDYEMQIPMIAPAQAGTYSELWEIYAVDTITPVCQFWIRINVE